MSVQETQPEPETVVVKASGNGIDIFHLPDPEHEDRPQCGRNLEQSVYVSKPKSAIPHARCCKYCDGTIDYSAPTGEKLSTRLLRIGQEQAVDTEADDE